MFIKRIRLQNFKKFKSLEKEFSPGINVVKGSRNETGKSTLLEGILTALFENPKSSGKALDSLWTWGADEKGHLCLEFSVDGKDYVLDKDFNSRSLQLVEQESQRHWNTPRQMEDKLDSLLGTTSRNLFLSTCCIKQDDLRAVQSGREEVSHSMERIITGSAQGITATEALKELNDAISDLKRGVDRLAKSPGAIASLRQAISELQEKLVNARGSVKEVEKLRLELPEVTQDLEKVTQEYSRCHELLDMNAKRQTIEKNIEELSKEYNTIDELISKIERLRNEQQEAKLKLQDLHGFDDEKKVASIRDELLKLDTERQSIERDLPKRKSELMQVETELKERFFLTFLASRAALMVGALLAVAGFSLMLWQRATAIVGIVGIMMLMTSWWARDRITALVTKKTELKGRISDMETALQKTREKEASILSDMKCTTRDEFERKFTLYEGLVKTLHDCEKNQSFLLQRRSYEELEEQRRDIIKKLRIEEDRLTDDLKNTKLSPEELLTYQKRANELEGEKKALEDRKKEIEWELKRASCDPEDISRLEEELQELETKLQAEEQKLHACELARDFINRARQETLEAVHDELQRKIQNYFCTFTNGKYKMVQLEPGTLKCAIFSDEKGDWVKPEELSGGTIDQFYLAYRLALAQTIYRDRQPPLILDDPFYNFDPVRLSRALASLKELSKNQQVIIFTLGDTYDSIADRVIELSTEYPR